MASTQIAKQVIDLFRKHPSFRDERYETVEYILLRYYREHYGHSIKSDFKILSDIDRAFRLVQQNIPELRGKTWLARQKQGGELSSYDEEAMAADIQEVASQMSLFPKEVNNY